MTANPLSFARDLSGALRKIARAPGGPALAIVTLAGGLTASLVAFVLARDVLLRPLPFRQPDRLVRLLELSSNGRVWWPSYLNCADWRTALQPVFADVGCADADEPQPVIVGGQAIRASVARASRGLFETLGVRPIEGRLFADAESRPGGPNAAIVSARFWRTALQSRPLEGVSILVGDAAAPVIGVLPDDFAFLGSAGAWSRADIWTPLDRGARLGSRTSHGYHTVARLRDGVSLEHARAEMPALSAALKAAHREPTQADSIDVRRLSDVVTKPAQAPVTVLTWAAGAVLLVACLNFAASLLARGLEEQRLMRLRLALGARRADLIRLMLAESLALAVPAVLLGVAGAALAIRWLAASAAGALPRLDSVTLDAGAVIVAAAAAVICALAAGLAPALMLSRRVLATAIGSRGAVGGSRGVNRLWSGFVGLQVALTLVLLVETGLLVRSFVEAARVDLGYQTRGVVAVELDMPPSRYADNARRLAMVRAVVDAVKAVSGVESAGVSSQLPTDTSSMMSGTVIAARPNDGSVMSALRLVDAGYFDALHIPVPARVGELASPGVAYADQTLARRLWNSASPLGDLVEQGFAPGRMRVAGVTGAVREWDQGDEPYGTLYLSWTSAADLPLTMFVFARGAGADLRQIQAAAARVDPFVAATARPLAAATAEPLRGRRLLMLIAVAFGVVAAVLSCAGTYAMVMFAVRRGLREAAIRLALGASTSHVRAAFLRSGLWPAVAGIAVGLAAARPAAALVRAQLFHVGPGDPWVLLAATLALGLAAGLAALLPARRAARVDPVVLLRDD